MPPSPWYAGNPSPSSPVAERMAWKIRRNEYRLDIYIGIEFMLDKERRVWVYMCSGRISEEWVGLVHLQHTQDPRIQSTCYYSNSLNRQITFHTAQRMSVCNHRDRRKSSRTFIVTPRGIFLHVILDHSLTFSFHPHSPNLMPPARYLTTPPKSPHSPPPPLLSPVLDKQGGTLISVVKLAARDRTLNEWFKVSSEQLSQLINLLMAVHVWREARDSGAETIFSCFAISS